MKDPVRCVIREWSFLSRIVCVVTGEYKLSLHKIRNEQLRFYRSCEHKVRLGGRERERERPLCVCDSVTRVGRVGRKTLQVSSVLQLWERQRDRQVSCCSVTPAASRALQGWIKICQSGNQLFLSSFSSISSNKILIIPMFFDQNNESAERPLNIMIFIFIS